MFPETFVSQSPPRVLDAPEKMLFVFLPSVMEIKESPLNDPYLAGLAKFYESLADLYEGLGYTDLNYIVWTGVGVANGQSVARFAPPTVAEIVLYLGTSGVALAGYKLLKLWVESKNGRKLRVKMGDFEIEATQMSERQFQRMFDILYEQRKKILHERMGSMDDWTIENVAEKIGQENRRLRERLLDEGIFTIDTDSREIQSELAELMEAFIESLVKARMQKSQPLTRDKCKGDIGSK